MTLTSTTEHPPAGVGDRAQRLAALAGRLLGGVDAHVVLLGEGGRQTAAPLAALTRLVISTGAPVVVPDLAAGPLPSGASGAFLGVPLTARGGRVTGVLSARAGAPRTWSPADLDLLQRLAPLVVAEVELARLSAAYDLDRVVWQLAVDAAGVGAFDCDLRAGVLRWDARLRELLEAPPGALEGTLDAFGHVVHAEDLPRLRQALEAAVESRGRFDAEFRVVLPGGGFRWVTARGRCVSDPAGTPVRVVGAAFDTTVAVEGEARVARMLESMPTAFFAVDRGWRFTYVNAEAERLLGRRREELVGGVLWELFPAAVDSPFEREYRRAATTGEPVAFDAYYPAPLEAWYDVRAWPTDDGLSVYFLDVTARHAAQAEAERAAARDTLLAGVSGELSGTLDVEVAVGRLAALVVPGLADWCVVTLADDVPGGWRRALRDVGWAHADAATTPVLAAYAEARLAALTDDSFLVRAAATGATVVVERDATRRLHQVLATQEARDLCSALAPESALVVPLPGRERPVGLLSAFRGPDRPRFAPADVVTLQNLGRRAGPALDNARLFSQQRDLARTLRRSLRTEAPDLGRFAATLHHREAPGAALDRCWHDAFLRRDGTVVAVVGEVTGGTGPGPDPDGPTAAVNQLRGAVRAVALGTAAEPGVVLDGVQDVMAALHGEVTASVVLATVDADGVLRWSVAGGGVLRVAAPGGEPAEPPGPAPGPPLGLVGGPAPRPGGTVRLAAGTAVSLATSAADDSPASEVASVLLRVPAGR